MLTINKCDTADRGSEDVIAVSILAMAEKMQ